MVFVQVFWFLPAFAVGICLASVVFTIWVDRGVRFQERDRGI